MNKYRRSYLLIILLITGLLPAQLKAQILHFRKFTTSDGLIQGTILALRQDSIGRIWIGTSEGISVYDGQSFENLSSQNGLKNEITTCFFEVRSGKMLIGTDGAGVTLSIHPPGRSDTLIGALMGKRFLCQDSVNNIVRDADGNLWFCTDGGVTSWKLASGKNMTVQQYGKAQGLKGGQVTDVAKGPDGILWFSTVNGVFKEKNGHFAKIIRTNGPNRIIATALCFDNQGTLWIGTQDQGIMSYQNHHITSYPWGNSRALGRINTIIVDRFGTMWFGTNNGLVRYNEKRNNVTQIDQHSGLTDNYILSLLQDREGNIWIGTQNGLDLYLADGFESISLHPGYFSQIFRAPKGNILAVSTSGIFRVRNYQLSRLQLLKKIDAHHINRIFYSSVDSLWILADHNMYLYDIIRSRLRKIVWPDGKTLRNASKLAQDQNGNIWIGTDHGLDILTGKGPFKIPSASSRPNVPPEIKQISRYPFPGSSLRALMIDHKKRVWLGYWEAGLYMLDSSGLKHFGNRDGLTSRMIRGLFEDRSGNIWIATRDKGVFRYDGKTFRDFSKQNVLESNWIRCITQDSRGRMWFGTAHGLSMYDGKMWRNYHSLPGLLIDDVNCVYPLSSDTILFGTSGSLFLYRYPGENKEQNLSTIYIKNVTQGECQIGTLPHFPVITHFDDIYRFLTSSISYPALNPLHFSHNELIIEIAGVQFQKSQELRYSYKLVGLDSSWTTPGRHTLVNYRNLPPGRYTFLAKTKVNGIWNSVPASLSFTIMTPYWQKFWFIGLMALLGILLIVTMTSLVNRYRYKQLLRLAQLRSDIASDLHDDIGSALSSISIYSELARREVKNNPAHAARFSERVENISRNLMDSMNDIIWSINPGNETLADVMLRMEEFVVGLLEAKGMEVYLKTPENIPNIAFDLHTRHNLLLIFKEITNNTARHSGATKAVIEMEVAGPDSTKKKSPYMLRIIFSDNGQGFDTMRESEGNGLRNIKKRSEDIGGKLVVTSRVGKGTKMELSVPLKP